MATHDNQSAPVNLTAMEMELHNLEEKFGVLHTNTNDFFLIVIAILIFFMTGGFAFLEAGSVRTKNTVNILIKNMVDSLIGGVCYWGIGWGLAYGPGGNGFCGGSNFFSYGMAYASYPAWFFQYVFAATASTILSGAVAERCSIVAYFVYSSFITAWMYPVVSHWVWDTKTPGFLNAMGFIDFAGSGTVHLLGGVAALVGCVLIGPRHGRFDPNGKAVEMPGHSVPLASLGGFILVFGFLAFNGGSQASITNPGDPEAVARAIVNTIIGGCGGGLTVLFANKVMLGAKWSYLFTLNGMLTGMVAQCSGCNQYQPWAALVIGCIAGFGYLGVHLIMLKLKLDDPLDAVAVHVTGGTLGVLAAPFFVYDIGILYSGNTTDAWMLLGINLLGWVIIASWSGFWSIAMFWPLKHFGLLRVSREVEFRGNDLEKHGEAAYPAEAWIEIQYNKDDSKNNVGSLPGNMGGTSGRDSEAYNNPFHMVPTSGKLFRGVSSFGMLPTSSSTSTLDKAETNNAYEVEK